MCTLEPESRTAFARSGFACVPNELRPQRILSGEVRSTKPWLPECVCAGMCGYWPQSVRVLRVYVCVCACRSEDLHL